MACKQCKSNNPQVVETLDHTEDKEEEFVYYYRVYTKCGDCGYEMERPHIETKHVPKPKKPSYKRGEKKEWD